MRSFVNARQKCGIHSIAITETSPSRSPKPLFRRKSRSVTLAETPPPAKPEPVRRPAKVAQQLALAHHLQAAIDFDRGAVADGAAVARKLGLTRAQVTQLLDLLLLAPDLQDAVLGLEAVDGAEPMAERTLRAVAHAGTRAEQRAAWARRRATSEAPELPST